MAAGGAETQLETRSGAVSLLAVLGLLAVGACVLAAVTGLNARNADRLDAEAQAAAEHQAGRIALALRDVESSVEHLDPAVCGGRPSDPDAGPVFVASQPRVPAPVGVTLHCVPAGTDRLDRPPVDLTDRGVQVALAQSRDQGSAVLSAPGPDVPPLVVGPVYRAGDALSLVPSQRQLQVRRTHLVGHVIAVLDVTMLLEGGEDWQVSDASTVLARTGDVRDDPRVSADIDALGRRWTIATGAAPSGSWRPYLLAVGGLGVAGAALLGLADRQRRRAVGADVCAIRQAEQRAAAIRTLTGIVQNSQDLDQVLPALAVQLSDELGLEGLSLAVATASGAERAIYTHGARPDPTVRPSSRRPQVVPTGSTVAFDLHRAERSVAVLRATAGRPLDADALELLEVTGEMITSTIVSGRSIEQQQEAVARLEALDELKTTFLGVASHELRTPATAISGLATLLATRWDALGEDDRRAFATRIATNAEALNALVQDLLDFARIERGDLRLALTPVDLTATVERVLARLDNVWGSHRVIPSVAADVEVLGDVNALERIITNLVSNAVKFSPSDADVHVTVERRAGRARLLVDDSGPGVPEEEREKIFVRFFRGAGDAVVRTRGVGIGLSVVQDFVAQMGGSVHVEDSPTGGARFVVELNVLDRSRLEERDAATT